MPKWKEVSERLLTANPGGEEAVASVLRISKAKYGEIITDIATSVAINFLRERPPIATNDTASSISRKAILFAAKPEATEMRSTLRLALAICFVEAKARAECAPVTEVIERARGAADPERSAFVNALAAVNFGAVFAIQMSLDSGSPLALIDRSEVSNAGLKWPE